MEEVKKKSFAKRHMKKFTLLPVAVILIGALIAVNVVATMFYSVITAFIHGRYVDTTTATLSTGEHLARDIQAEGTVLLLNRDISDGEGGYVPALPLQANPMPEGDCGDEIQENWERTRLAVFGWGATDRGIILGGSGSGSVTQNMTRDQYYTLRDGLKQGGFEYYEPVMEMMESFGTTRQGIPVHGALTAPWHNGFWNLYEPSAAMYQPHMASARDFARGTEDVRGSNTALIVISRLGGEGVDLPHHQNIWNSGTNEAGTTIYRGRTYLELTEAEEAMMELVFAQNFERVVVMLNISNPMDLSFLDDTRIHAAFVTGFMGQYGAVVAADILRGYRTERERVQRVDADGNLMYDANENPIYIIDETIYDENGELVENRYRYRWVESPFSPSGRTVNTFTRGFEHSPTFLNSNHDGAVFFDGVGGTAGTDIDRTGGRSIAYLENIFTGYWYYETARYMANLPEGAPGSLTQAQFNYDNIVKFPLGFGLSFTEFSWEVEAVRIGENGNARGATLTADDVIEIDVRVTNIGNWPGQEVVQAYFAAPYIHGEIEKPYIRLAAFAKTAMLVPYGEEDAEEETISSQVVTLSFLLEDMASYDAYDRNNNSFAGFEFDPGVHYVRLQNNARFIADDDNSGVTFISESGTADMESGSAVIEFTVPQEGIRYNQNRTVENTVYTVTLDSEGNPLRDEEGDVILHDTGRREIRQLEYARNRFTGPNAFAGVQLDGTDSMGLTISTDPANTHYMTRANLHQSFPQRLARIARPTHAAFATGFVETGRQNVAGPRPQSGVDNGHRLFLEDESGNVSLSFPNHDLLMQLGSNFDDPLWDELLDQIPLTGSISHAPNFVSTGMNQFIGNGGFITPAMPSIGKPLMMDLDGPSGLNVNMSGELDRPDAWTAYPVAFILAQSWNRYLATMKGVNIAAEARATGISGWYAPGANIHRSPFSGRNFEYYSESAVFTGVMVAHKVAGATAGGIRAYIKHWVANDGEINRYQLNTFLSEQALREIYLKPFQMAVRDGNANALMSSFNRLGSVWTGGNGALNNDILRGEWGFRGSIVTDYAQGYMHVTQGLRNGNDLWLAGGYAIGSFPPPMVSDTDVIVARMATHNILYTLANSYYHSMVSDVELGDMGGPGGLNFHWWLVWGMFPINLLLVFGLLLCVFFAFKPQINALIDKKTGKRDDEATDKVETETEPELAMAGAEGGSGDTSVLDAADGGADVVEAKADEPPTVDEEGW